MARKKQERHLDLTEFSLDGDESTPVIEALGYVFLHGTKLCAEDGEAYPIDYITSSSIPTHWMAF